MEYGEETKLKMGAELRGELERVLMERGEEAVSACVDRDASLADYADLLSGVALPQYDIASHAMSTVVHPMTRIKHTELLSNLAQPLKRDPIVQVTARIDADKEDAKLQEAWLNDTFAEEGFKSEYYSVLHNLLRDPAAVLFAGWEDKTKKVEITEYWDGESVDEDFDPLLIPAELRDPEFAGYEEVSGTYEEVVKSGAVYRCVDLVNFYLIPSTARSVKEAQGTLERMVLTETDLLSGIETYGYTKTAVMEIIKAGGTLGAENEYRDRQNETAGITETQDSTANEGEFECFLYHGNLPYLWDGDGAKLPKRLWNTQVCAMWCPSHQIVFKLSESPYPAFPYFMNSLLPTPNRSEGTGMVEILEPFAQESTHFLRALADGTDIQAQPAFTMDDDVYDANKGMEFYPGARFISIDGRKPEPIPMGQNALMNTEILGYLEQQGNKLASQQGLGELQGKVRKNGEIANMQQAADTKFDLYQWNAYSMVPEIAAWRVAMELHFSSGTVTTYQDGAEKMNSPDLLKKTFRYSVPQTSTDSSPEAREQKSATIIGLQTQYLQAKMAASQVNPQTGMPSMLPEDLELVYNAISDALTIADVREPERIIGKKPQTPQQGMPMNPMAAGMANNPMGQMMAGGGMNGQPAGNGAEGVPAGFA